jgi:signal transduction histidine kinase
MRVLGSLTNRIFIACLVLASVSIGATVWVVRAGLLAETEAGLVRDLTAAAGVVDRQQETLFESFTRTARLLADLPRFKAAVDTGDPPTVQPIADEYQRLIGSDLLIVTDRRGQLLARVGAPVRGVLRVVSVPVSVDQEQLGTLTAGYLLDEDRAMELRSLTGADIAFAAGADVRASTLGPASAAALSPIAARTDRTTVFVGGAEYVALARPLRPADAAPIAGALNPTGPPAVVVLHSRTERMRTLNVIQAYLAGLAIVSLALAAGISYVVARTITRPLAAITDHMRQVAATGDLTKKIDLAAVRRWDDDDAQVLARTFNALTDSIATFQRDAAQRERLSSLGRLSTVIAHEVRNPLMIIKGALRSLTRRGAAAEDIRDAATDIDGEIDRLNHLVNDVLDFARPIRFQCGDADLNALCRDAANAIAAGGQPAVGLSLGSPLPVLVTDRDRLRTVLINLLSNAQDAVHAKGTGPLASAPADSRPPEVTLVTEAVGPRRVAITVRDRGTGIAADDLPRIFDPYFTTRRTGSGLGLAICKNIIEGLGGTIGVTTHPGRGTDFRVEIGDAPASAS